MRIFRSRIILGSTGDFVLKFLLRSLFRPILEQRINVQWVSLRPILMIFRDLGSKEFWGNYAPSSQDALSFGEPEKPRARASVWDSFSPRQNRREGEHALNLRPFP